MAKKKKNKPKPKPPAKPIYLTYKELYEATKRLSHKPDFTHKDVYLEAIAARIAAQ